MLQTTMSALRALFVHAVALMSACLRAQGIEDFADPALTGYRMTPSAALTLTIGMLRNWPRSSKSRSTDTINCAWPPSAAASTASS